MEGPSIATARVLQGKELSYNNIVDADAALQLVMEFDETVCVAIKHTNPCGAATGPSTREAYVRARDADPLSAFGGIVGLNRPIDADSAKAITSTFIEAVIAPSVAEEARAGDLVIVMSNGGFDNIHQKLLSALHAREATP